MTDTTDIKALQRPSRKHYDWSKAVWMDCDRCGEAHTGTVLADDGARICAGCCDAEYYSAWEDLAERAIKLLEAERQLSDALHAERDEFRRRLKLERSILEDADKELAALKSDQVPVAWTDAEELRGMEKDGCGYLFKVDPANPFTDPRRQIMLYEHPQKPVVLPPVEKWRKPDEVRAQNAYRILVQKEIKAAGGIVKDGKLLGLREVSYMKEKCLTCGKEMSDEPDSLNLNCGGDCLECMASHGDPDCISAVAIIKARKHDAGSNGTEA